MHIKGHLKLSVQFLLFIILLTEIFHLSSFAVAAGEKWETVPRDLDDPHKSIYEKMESSYSDHYTLTSLLLKEIQANSIHIIESQTGLD